MTADALEAISWEEPAQTASSTWLRYPTRVLSGIQPTLNLHLGHYFGAIRHQIALHHEYPFHTYCLIADYHALVRGVPPDEVRDGVVKVATAYLAFGLDPAKAMLFRQSDVPAVCELAWILSTMTPHASAARIATFKQKRARARSVGLLAYPVLQAADILSMRATVVPAGIDQETHIQLAARVAQRFNRRVNREVFPLPKVRLSRSPEVPGTDGEKMHTPSNNTIDLFQEPHYLVKRVTGIKTTPAPRGQPIDPDKCTVFKLLTLVCDDATMAGYRDDYEKGAIGYKEAKERLLVKLIGFFAEYEERYYTLKNRPNDVLDVLSEGFRNAKREAAAVLEIVREAIGLRGRSRLTGNR